MKNLKKLFAILICVSMLLSSVPMVLSANADVAPEFSTTYPYALFENEGIFWTTLSATGNTAITMDNENQFPRINGGAGVDATDAKYLEFDIYTELAITNSIGIWVSSNAAAESGRVLYSFPTLNAGWNHIVIDLYAELTRAEWAGSYDKSSVKGFFFDGIPTTAQSVALNLKFANVAFTTDVKPIEPEPEPELGNDPTVIPEVDYKYNLYTKVESVNLYGEKTNTTDERFFDWQQYYEQASMNPTVNINEADYIEFYFYSDTASDLSIALGSLSLTEHQQVGGYFNFYDVRSNSVTKSIKAGWNRVVLETSDFKTQHPGTVAVGTYDNTKVNGIIITGINASYVHLTNVAFTKEAPVANFSVPAIDYIDGIVATKSWGPNASDIYNVIADRLFITFDSSIDASKAEYLEFDIYTDGKMNDMVIWLCNNLDDTNRNQYRIPTSSAVVGEWTHIVVDLAAALSFTVGTFDASNWTSVFFEGDPNPESETINIKIANMGVSKNYPDMNPTYTLVGTAVDGIASSVTIPAGASMYPSYQMFRTFDAIDMSNANFIELDIYASKATQSEFAMWSSLDVDAVRGYFKVPVLKEGWNHVVIDINKNFGAAAGGFTLESFTSWSAYFFDGTPCKDYDIAMKVANVVVTKFTPYADYTYIEVVSYPEINIDVTGEDDTFSASDDFAKNVDFSKGDNIEFDAYVSEVPTNDITVSFFDTNRVGTTVTLTADSLKAGWNHIVFDIADLSASEGFTVKSVSSVSFAGTDNIRFATANFALTAKEAFKQTMVYNGKVISKLGGYNNVTVEASGNLLNAADTIVLPVAMDLTDIDYIEMNLYVTAKCDLTFYLNATPVEDGEMFAEADAYYALDNLSYGWNQIKIPVADLLANEYFDPAAVTYIYFEGVPATTYDVTFTVEGLAATSTTQEFDIVEGDYNVDDAVDMRDLIHVVNQTLASEQGWFANVAEVAGADNGIIDAIDVTALRKLLFANF